MRALALILLATATLSACDDSDGDDNYSPPVRPPVANTTEPVDCEATPLAKPCVLREEELNPSKPPAPE